MELDLRRLRHDAATVSLALAVAACGAASGGSPAPSTAATTPAAVVATAHSAAGTTPPPTVRTSPGPTAAALPELTLEWAETGPNPSTPCCWTWWPDVDPLTGNVWVANSFAHEYWIFTPEGEFVGSWGKAGTGDGEFDFGAHRAQSQAVGAIAFAPDGSFYVADNGNHRVQQFDADRTFIRAWGTFGADDGQFASPFGIVTDGTTVYVADDDRGDLQAFDPTGNHLRTFGETDISAGIFIALDDEGNLYRAGPTEGEITVFDPSGETTRTINLESLGGVVLGLAMAPNGHLYVNLGADLPDVPPNRLAELDADDSVVNVWSTGGESGVVTPDGSAIYLANTPPSGASPGLRKYALPSN